MSVINKTKDRKSELLIIARRSRIKWIRCENNNNTNSSNKLKETEKGLLQGKNNNQIIKTTSTSKIPSAETLQKTFDFLSTVVADGELVDVDSLIRRIDFDYYDDRYYDEIRDEEFNPNPKDSADSISQTPSLENYTYAVFLEALCSRDAVNIVKSKQQFISKFESAMRMRKTSLDSLCFTNGKLDQNKTADSLWNFCEYITMQMECSSVPLWNINNEEYRTLSAMYCQKFVFSKLYPSTFYSDYEDCFLNEKLRDRILSLSFLLPEHLDIKIFCHDTTTSTTPTTTPITPSTISTSTTAAVITTTNVHTINTTDTTHSADGIDTPQDQNKTQTPQQPPLQIPPPPLTQDLKLKFPWFNDAMMHLQSLESCTCPNDKIYCIKQASSSIAMGLMKFNIDRNILGNDNTDSSDNTSGNGSRNMNTEGNTDSINANSSNNNSNNSNSNIGNTMSSRGTPPGADELLPLLILCVKESNPSNLHSEVKYLQTYLDPSQLNSEAGYVLTQFASAVHFLEVSIKEKMIIYYCCSCNKCKSVYL